jgi:hypothetical protein
MEKYKQSITLHIKGKPELILKSIKNLSYFSYFTKEISKNLIKFPFFIKGNPSEDEGATFIQIFDQHIKVYMKVKSLIQTDYFVKIIYKAYKTIPTSFEFEYNVIFFFTGIEDCLLYSNYNYSKKISLPRISVYDERERRKKIFLNIQQKLFDNFLDKIDICEILIHANFKLVFDILLNMKLVNKYIQIFGEIIDYNGNVIKENNIITIYKKENNTLKEDIYIKIVKIEKKENEGILSFQKENINKEKIIFIIYGDEENTMLYMVNKFNDILEPNILNNLLIEKKKKLSRLKKIIENYYKNNER